MSKDIAFPISIGANGDITSVTGYEECVFNKVKFCVLSEMGTINAFPEFGASPAPFGVVVDQYFAKDLLGVNSVEVEEALLEQVEELKEVDVTISWVGDGVLHLEINYETKQGTLNHYSTDIYTLEGG